MLGYVEHREALIWIAVDNTVKEAEIRYYIGNSTEKRSVRKKVDSDDHHVPLRFVLQELEMNTAYNYEIWLDGKKIDPGVPCKFRTKELWEWRKDPPPFSFLYGSCAYRNDSLYDRPGKPYGRSTKIFETMANLGSNFTVWNGDNLYFRESDYTSRSGMLYRYSYDRKAPELKNLLAARPNFSLWDDHDFGPNDSNGSFDMKEVSRELFTNWWGNRSFGEHGQGVYSKFEWSDCDFYLLDDRWFRSANKLPDSLNGKPNPDKLMFGKQQMDWLKNNLLTGRATFKFIVCGGQILNPISQFEGLNLFPHEYFELLNFIKDNKIEGVVFLTGDRHMTEMIRIERPGLYPLYDFTCSPLSSGTYQFKDKDPELNNPYRVQGSSVTVNNFSRVSVTGPRNERILKFEVYDENEKLLWQYKIDSKELKNLKK